MNIDIRRPFSVLTFTCATAALVAGCGESQPPIGMSGATRQNGAMNDYNAPYSPVGGVGKSVMKRQQPFRDNVVHKFGDNSGGFWPIEPLLYHGGLFYGTTSYGADYGTIFSMTKSGRVTVLHNFDNTNDGGQTPSSGLTYDNGALYGTTGSGGAYCETYSSIGCGTVFSITPSGVEKVLHSFRGGGSDGSDPMGGLVNVNGTLYGTTEMGGTIGCGTVFSLTTGGTEKVLYSFCRADNSLDGDYPTAGLHYLDGIFYGTTTGGGAFGGGTVFSITTTGIEKVVYSFGSVPDDGGDPSTGLIDIAGTLYGTTAVGGLYCCSYDNPGGTVFSVTTTGTEQILHSFGSGIDGSGPNGPLVNVKGVLYGTTEVGGTCCHDNPSGTVFSISTSGAESVLHDFGKRSDGGFPRAGLIYAHGKLWGTTQGGGGNGCNDSECGTVFSLKIAQ